MTFEEKNGKTLVVVHDLYPSKAALDEAIETGSAYGTNEDMFAQLVSCCVGETGTPRRTHAARGRRLITGLI